MKKYITPNVEVIASNHCAILSSSNYVPYCNDCCKLWHICRDRSKGKPCADFTLKI